MKGARGYGELKVKDDGKGLPVEGRHEGNGLGNMEARAKAIGGTLALRSAPGAGTEVVVRFPLD